MSTTRSTDDGYTPTHPRAGSNKDRQSVGDPGHCERCAEVGHVRAHPSLGCGDVGCESAHGQDDPRDAVPAEYVPTLLEYAEVIAWLDEPDRMDPMPVRLHRAYDDAIRRASFGRVAKAMRAAEDAGLGDMLGSWSE